MLSFFFLLCGVKAQQAADQHGVASGTTPKFHIALYTGIGVAGPTKDLMEHMKDSGFGDSSYGGWFSDGQEYPEKMRIPVLRLEAAYFINEKRSFSLNLGFADVTEVSGFDSRGIGNYLTLRSRLHQVAANYIISLKERRHNLSLGPVFFLHEVEDTHPYSNHEKYRNIIPGLNAGYSLQLVQRKSWFLALNTTARWAPKSRIGPFVVEHEGGTPLPDMQRSEFSATKVTLSGLDVGVAAGLNFNRKEKNSSN